MSVEHHLLGLARIGAHERQAAVAQPDMSHLHRRGHPVQQNDLVAPVELVGFTGIEAQGDEGRRRCLVHLPVPCRRITPDSVIPACVAKTAKRLEDADQRQPVPLPAPGILGQHAIQIVPPRANLRLRLNRALIAELRLAGPDHLAHDLPRNPQLTADLLDRLPLLKIRTPDLRDRLHNQHPKLCPRMNSEA